MMNLQCLWILGGKVPLGQGTGQSCHQWAQQEEAVIVASAAYIYGNVKSLRFGKACALEPPNMGLRWSKSQELAFENFDLYD